MTDHEIIVTHAVQYPQMGVGTIGLAFDESPQYAIYDGTYTRSTPSLPPIPCHIYADWLDENGEPQAAEKLRKAFPIPAE